MERAVDGQSSGGGKVQGLQPFSGGQSIMVKQGNLGWCYEMGTAMCE